MSDPAPLVGVVVVLAALLLVYAILTGGLRRLPAIGVARHHDRTETRFTVAFSGITTAIALQLTVAFVGGAGAFPSVSIGVVVGSLFGIAERQRRRYDPYWARLARRTVEGVVGLLVAVPVSVTYFTSSSGCNASGQPQWLSVLLFAGVVLSLAAAILLAVLRMTSGRLFALLDVFLAYFAALELAVFFVSPFGLQLADLSSFGWLVSLGGVVLVLAATAISPRLVVPAAGAVLAVATIVIDTTVGEACSPRSYGGLGVLAAYAITFVLIAVLGRRGRRR